MLKWKYVVVLVYAILMSACANIDEGEVDYVRTMANKSAHFETNIYCNKEEYASSLAIRAGNTRPCYETLYRKYTPVPAIKVGDSISVHLMQAFIQDAKEWKSWSEFFTGKASNAEIVVLANVCEQGISGCSLAFGPSADKNGRVVYFSNGVKAKQYLNFSYLPVYGPIEYKGGPLIIQLAVLELDELSPKQKALISTLADIGKKAYPPASEVLTVLDKLGSSFLSGSNNDTVFRYTFTLAPSGGVNNYQHPKVAAGNFAFVKKKTIQYQQEKEIWDELKFDHLTGRLVKRCTPDDEKLKQYTYLDDNGNQNDPEDFNPCTEIHEQGYGYKDYRDNTYLTFQVQSGFPAKTLDNIQTLTLLLEDITSEQDRSAEAVQQSLTELSEHFSHSQIQKELRTSLSSINNLVFDVSSYHLDEVTAEVGKYISTLNSAKENYQSHCTDKAGGKGIDKSLCSKQLQLSQLTKEIMHGRRLLTLMDSSADLNSILPLSLDNDFNSAAFVLSYQKYYQRSRFNAYWRGILNLTQKFDSYSRFKDDLAKNIDDKEKKEKRIKRVLNNFKSELREYLWSLKHEIERYSANTCRDFNLGASVSFSPCVKTLSKADLTKIAAYLSAVIQRWSQQKLTPSCAIDGINDEKASCEFLTVRNISDIIGSVK